MSEPRPPADPAVSGAADRESACPEGASLTADRSTVVLAARGLRLGYPGRDVLRGVSLTVRRGEFWFVLGPNGTGKTTLLSAVLGVLKPLSGSIELSERLGDGRRIGFVPQRCNLKATLPMTVADFVRLGLTRTGISRREGRQNLAWALEEAGLAGKGRADYWSLSGGQRQRALVARGLVRRPDLLILDEPTNGLDLPAEESFLTLVARLNRERGITVILVTHAVGIAARFGSHAALIRGGTVLAGPLDAVLAGPILSEAYGVGMKVLRNGGSHPTVSVAGSPCGTDVREEMVSR